MVDTVGNRLGPRAVYEYETDGGDLYNILLDESVADAVGNEKSTNNHPAIRATGRRPYEPRYILLALDSDPSVSKKAIICDNANVNFAADESSTLSINGVDWNITGRVGEKASYLVPTGTVT